MTHDRTPRVAFVHIMKTGGSFVNQYLTSRVLRPAGYRTFNSWNSLERDWTKDELMAIRESQPSRAYVHNHAGGWDEESVEGFQEAGWSVFSFVRHPGDQWCSFFHWAKGRPGVRALSLDAFLRRAFSGGFPRLSRQLDVPAYWRRLDFVQEFNHESFARMLQMWFGHRFEAGAVPAANVSGNLGYPRYLAEGAISRETDDLLRASDAYQTFELIRARSIALVDA